MKFVNHSLNSINISSRHFQSMKPRLVIMVLVSSCFTDILTQKADGLPESWHDTVIRVMNGLFSIRKDWYIRNHIPWDESF